jgi:hypothetical protein
MAEISDDRLEDLIELHKQLLEIEEAAADENACLTHILVRELLWDVGAAFDGGPIGGRHW